MEDTVFINTPDGVADLVDLMALRSTSLGDSQPPFYIDLEGDNLSRDGNISLLTVLMYGSQSAQQTYIIDTHTLRSAAFSIAGKSGQCLKHILENPQMLKVFFDVRNDSDALHAHYGIKLQGVLDVQVMESACRRTTANRRLVSGLSRCIQEVISGQERVRWRLCKERGEYLWNPDKGGSYSVFNRRPLPEEVKAYCVGDVQYLPVLYHHYRRGSVRWRNLVAEVSQDRVAISQTAAYEPHGPAKALGPWSAEQNRILDSWSEVNP